MSKIDYSQLTEALACPEEVVSQWAEVFANSALRLPQAIERQAICSMIRPVVAALAEVLGPDRAGHPPLDLRFLAGARHLREVEKSVSFVASNLGTSGFGGFDVGALVFALRDVLIQSVQGPAATEMQAYMEWLAVLAGDSLATGRELAAQERWRDELDNGLPLVMVTQELPAAFFLCQPDARVVAGVFSRLLLTIVRTGAKAAIVDVGGMSCGLDPGFADALQRFCEHPKVSGKSTLFACGVRNDDVDSWKAIADAAGTEVIFENYFDICVTQALNLGGCRLIHG